MNRRLAIAAAVAVIGLGGWLWSSGVSNPGAGFGVNVATAQDAGDIDTSQIQEMYLGNPDADVTVIEYASFTCPHCKNFHASVFKDLKANYIDTNKIKFVYREVYFDRFGLWAGMIARCGGPTRYFGLADLIYDNQKDWIGSGDPAEIADNLRRLGKTAGLSDEMIDACMNDGEKAQAMVALFQQNSTADGINSTPTFIINGTKYSNMNYQDFSAILDELLGE